MNANKSHSGPKRKGQRRAVWLAVLVAAFALGTRGLAAAETRTIIFFGDSLTAGYGLDSPDSAFPALIQRKIDAAGLAWHCVNAGLSGETTAGGLRRLDWILRQPVDIFVIELGGNDGLRGITVESTRSNLQAMIDRIRLHNPRVKVVLAGMQLPPNLGADYTRRFADMYPELARTNQLTLIPFLLDGVGGVTSLNQADGIHPTVEGHQIVAETVWRILQPLL